MEQFKSTVQLSIERYCNYQPRSHKEVKNKLYEIGCKTAEVNEYISLLIQSGHLNEEQYARAIARGKFRIKQWGRNKIINALKIQEVSPYCIKKALTEIDEDEYRETLAKLAGKKWEELRGTKNQLAKKQKTYMYLLQKGYESSLVTASINEIINQQR